MNVTWLAFDEIVRTDAGYYSPVASLRYRLAIPLRLMEEMGHGVQLIQLSPEADAAKVAAMLSGEVVIISKVMYPGSEEFRKLTTVLAQVVEMARGHSRRLIVDVCDDLFALPEYGQFLGALVRGADLVTTSSARLAQIVGSRTPRPILVVEDPFEGERGEPRFAPPRARARSLLARLLLDALARRSRPLNLLWFGHGSNYHDVVAFIPQLERLAGRYSLRLELVTSAGTGAPALCTEFNARHAPLCELRFTPWSLDAVARGFADCDLVIIPARLDETARLYKSTNRLVQSLWCGRFVVAHPIESYRELAAYAWIGGDIVEGIEWALRNPRDVRRRIAAGQRHVAAHNGPAAIARQWEAALRAALTAPPVVADARIGSVAFSPHA